MRSEKIQIIDTELHDSKMSDLFTTQHLVGAYKYLLNE